MFSCFQGFTNFSGAYHCQARLWKFFMGQSLSQKCLNIFFGAKHTHKNLCKFLSAKNSHENLLYIFQGPITVSQFIEYVLGPFTPTYVFEDCLWQRTGTQTLKEKFLRPNTVTWSVSRNFFLGPMHVTQDLEYTIGASYYHASFCVNSWVFFGAMSLHLEFKRFFFHRPVIVT